MAVAYRSWMLNQTLAKDLVATLSLGVADCGHKPNIPIKRQVLTKMDASTTVSLLAVFVMLGAS